MTTIRPIIFGVFMLALFGSFAFSKPASATPYPVVTSMSSSAGDHGVVGWYHHRHRHYHHHHYTGINIHL